MAVMKRQWALSFIWINLSVVIVLLIQVAGNQISTIRELAHILAFALIYANLSGALGVLLIGGLVERIAFRKFPLVPVMMLYVILFTAVGCLAAQTLLMATGILVPRHFWPDYFHTLRVAMPLAVVFGLGALLHALLRGQMQGMKEKLHEKEVAGERAKKLAVEARLSSLESRIHPHFLFNTLNSISSLIAIDPARAEQIVGRLATLLRASLDTSNQSLIPLRQELAMVESYVEIERVRLGEKLRGSVAAPAELQSAKVPPMSVQALVENAVIHGIAPRGGGEVRVTATTENGNLRIEVSDTGHGFDVKAIPAGHGLNSLVERLDALFGEKACLNVFRQDGHSVVEMVLPRV
jgi:LytS/YehU family sensor histidine kinase